MVKLRHVLGWKAGHSDQTLSVTVVVAMAREGGQRFVRPALVQVENWKHSDYSSRHDLMVVISNRECHLHERTWVDCGLHRLRIQLLSQQQIH